MEQILKKQNALIDHPVYETFKDLDSLRHFMSSHVFAVWDFMSLLKSLQREITCVELPWRPSPYASEAVRLINQIVLGEESDIGPDGQATSHFELYLKAMKEIGASTGLIRTFINTPSLSLLPQHVADFVKHNLDVAQNGHVVEVAASFFFGREKLIPGMFTTIVETLKANDIEAPTLLYYLERHIELDGEEHGPLALKCLAQLTQNDKNLQMMAERAGLKALEARKKLWDEVLKTCPRTQSPGYSRAQSNQQNLSLA